jgi:hypothetical protein
MVDNKKYSPIKSNLKMKQKKRFDYNKDGKLDRHEKDHMGETKTFKKFEKLLKKISKKR